MTARSDKSVTSVIIRRNKPIDPGWRRDLYRVVFEADTVAGRVFDIVLLVVILASVLVVSLNSIPYLGKTYAQFFFYAEWAFTIAFTIEYILRLVCVRNPAFYALSFFGVVDLLAIMPTYLALILPDAQYLIAVRALRLLRIFRIFKLVRFLQEADVLTKALQASMPKIVVFMTGIVTIVTVVGSLMYVVEGPENGFRDIPMSVYWAVVTLTTVGYGDIAPKTPLGQFLACIVMVLGYAIIAVPTGIMSVELQQANREVHRVCDNCSHRKHDHDSSFCKMCGATL